MSTARTILTRVRGVHSDESPTGPYCLVGEEVCELRPRRVSDALGETMGMHHPVDREVLDGNQIELIDNATAVLVREVTASPSDSFIDARHDLAPLGSLWCPFLDHAEASFMQRRRCALASACSSARKKRGFSMGLPCVSVAKVASPTSMPTSRPVGGRSAGSAHSHEKQTYHLPVLLRRIVAVLGVPSTGRCSSTLTRPTFAIRTRLSSASSRQPTGTCGKVMLS